MKKIIFVIVVALSTAVFLNSCASIFCGRRGKVVISDAQMSEPVNLTIDGRRYDNIMLPAKVKVKRGFKPSHIIVDANGYETSDITVRKRFNGVSAINLCNPFGWLIDAATGSIMKPEYNDYAIRMKKRLDYSPAYISDPTIPAGEAQNRVSRDRAGQTALERTVIRWYFDSDPRGARIYWRVI